MPILVDKKGADIAVLLRPQFLVGIRHKKTHVDADDRGEYFLYSLECELAVLSLSLTWHKVLRAPLNNEEEE